MSAEVRGTLSAHNRTFKGLCWCVFNDLVINVELYEIVERHLFGYLQRQRVETFVILCIISLISKQSKRKQEKYRQCHFMSCVCDILLHDRGKKVHVTAHVHKHNTYQFFIFT